MQSPFEHVRPLVPGAVSGRDEETAALVQRIRERRIVAIVAPRRFGKTSLIHHAMTVTDEVDPVPWQLSVDLYGVSSIFDFAVRLERAMGSMHPRHSRWLSDRFAGSEIGLSLAPGLGIKARVGRRDAPDPTQALHELLGALVERSRHGGGVLFLDEFQDIAHVDGLDALLRSHLQHAHDVAVLFAGSRPSMMRNMFTDRARAFYAQAEMFDLGPLEPAAARAMLLRGFESGGRDAAAIVDHVVARTGGHPQRTMLLADMLWQRSDRDDVLDASDLAVAVEAASSATAGEFEATWKHLAESSRNALRSVVRFGSPAARAGERFFDLTSGAAASAAAALVDDAVLQRHDDASSRRWALVDPLFADWIDQTFS